MPRISVVIPVYNGEAYLEDALDSILAQSRLPDEIIVVNDGSTDRTTEILKRRSDMIVIEQSNKGTGAARNLGIDHSCGDLLAFLDADDTWLPDKLQVQEQAMRLFSAVPAIIKLRSLIRNEGVSICHCHTSHGLFPAKGAGTIWIRRGITCHVSGPL